jgi:hypothetical protein
MQLAALLAVIVPSIPSEPLRSTDVDGASWFTLFALRHCVRVWGRSAAVPAGSDGT